MTAQSKSSIGAFNPLGRPGPLGESASAGAESAGNREDEEPVVEGEMSAVFIRQPLTTRFSARGSLADFKPISADLDSSNAEFSWLTGCAGEARRPVPS